jgi:hypothetical protein
MSEWIRVTKANPCPVCGHDSWCLTSLDGTTGLCMRVANDRPKQFKSGDVAYIWKLENGPVKVSITEKAPKAPEIDAESIMESFWYRTTPNDMVRLSNSLGVKASSVMVMKVAWASEFGAFAFPMRDGNGKIIGIRLRRQNGDKWSVTGSKSGLFLPYCSPEPHAYVVEGATDTLAALSINLFAVGRPSCSGGLFQLKTLFERIGTKTITIIADNDKPGLDGAETLVRNIQIPCCIITLPCKDLREFVADGGTVEMLESIEQSVVWRNHRES